MGVDRRMLRSHMLGSVTLKDIHLVITIDGVLVIPVMQASTEVNGTESSGKFRSSRAFYCLALHKYMFILVLMSSEKLVIEGAGVSLLDNWLIYLQYWGSRLA